jgi:catechol 2,3-dioxygenase-like lactoylglutathione lyase family enzyme
LFLFCSNVPAVQRQGECGDETGCGERGKHQFGEDGAILFLARVHISDGRAASQASGIDKFGRSPRQLDAAVAAIRKAGFVVVTEPWDAFWGQRYAIVADPDGYMSDLFAAL